MRILCWMRHLAGNERGNVLVLVAATMPLLIGSAGLGVDSIQLSLAKRQLQRAADSGAIAGAYAVLQSKPVSVSVNHDLTLNDKFPLASPAIIENAPTTGAYRNNTRAVRVVLTARRSTPFMSFFTETTPTLQAEATATAVYAGKFCMVSLEQGTSTGITFAGSSDLNLGCGVSTNSKSSTAVVASGSALIVASPISAVGGVPQSNGYVKPTTLLPYSPMQSNPYQSVPLPTLPSGCKPSFSVSPNQTTSAGSTSPGVYCYASYDIKGTWRPPAGSTIYVAGGTLSFGSQADVACNGCTFILTGPAGTTTPTSTSVVAATLSMHGGAVLNLTSPNSGIYKGLIMYQDPRAAAGISTHINGNSQSSFEGGFYFKRGDVTFNGNSGLRTECMQLVARRLTFTGNSSVQNTCPSDGGAQAFDATFVRLVA